MKRAAPNFSKRPSCCVVNQATLYRKKRKKATTKLLHSIIPSAFSFGDISVLFDRKVVAYALSIRGAPYHATTYAKFENECS
jgi:hypothetical protein